MGELKPCPFCGSLDLFPPETSWFKLYFVSCLVCDAEGPLAVSVELAKKRWNERGGGMRL
jgi:Lar family restriction alleviation protein